MARAVRFDHYGDRGVLYIADVDVPSPLSDEVTVEVRTAHLLELMKQGDDAFNAHDSQA